MLYKFLEYFEMLYIIFYKKIKNIQIISPRENILFINNEHFLSLKNYLKK